MISRSEIRVVPGSTGDRWPRRCKARPTRPAVPDQVRDDELIRLLQCRQRRKRPAFSCILEHVTPDPLGIRSFGEWVDCQHQALRDSLAQIETGAGELDLVKLVCFQLQLLIGTVLARRNEPERKRFADQDRQIFARDGAALDDIGAQPAGGEDCRVPFCQ